MLNEMDVSASIRYYNFGQTKKPKLYVNEWISFSVYSFHYTETELLIKTSEKVSLEIWENTFHRDFYSLDLKKKQHGIMSNDFFSKKNLLFNCCYKH